MKTLNTYINEWKANTSTVSSIKKTQYFVYNLYKRGNIKFFDEHWPQLDDYINKVYINGENINVYDNGWSVKGYDKGTYEVYIKDIDNVTTCEYMFYNCTELISVPLFDTSKVKYMNSMFEECNNLEEVPKFDTSNVENMEYMFVDCNYLKIVPLFNINNCNNMNEMFLDCYELSEETKNMWSKVYNFDTHKRI